MSTGEYVSIEAGGGATKGAIPTATAVPMVNVVAPSTLEAGYTFDAQVNGQTVTVTVPEGGVKQGQSFMAPVTTIVQDPQNVPRGRWRDGLCDCFRPGCCHPSLCLTFWCAPLALAQLMTRMQLNWCGEQTVPEKAANTFKLILILFLVYFGVDQLLDALMTSYAPEAPAGDDDAAYAQLEYSTAWYILYGLRAAFRAAFFLYILIMTIRTRSIIRAKYEIPTQQCNGCEDCCCSYWCSCCTITQMLRHTADYDSYEAACCTTTGLPNNVPVTVV